MASTSTCASGVLEELERLFSWNPPFLFAGQMRSTKSRSPSFYDKHFTKKLVLKTVQRLPSLVRDLARNVDKSLNAALKTLPPLSGFPAAQNREDDIDSLDNVVEDEKAISVLYQQTTARYCLCVASTLALHPTAPFSRWKPLLTWTPSGRSSAYAELRFIGEGHGETKKRRALILETMDSNPRLIFEDLRKSKSPLATWEFKNLMADSVEGLTAVPNLGRFSWTYCDPPKCPSHEKEKEMVKLSKVGPDAQAPPRGVYLSLVNRDEQGIQAASGSDPVRLPPPPPPSRSSSLSLTPLSDEETWSSTKDKEEKQMRDDDDKNRFPTKGKGKKRMRDDEDEDPSPAKRKRKKHKRDEDNDEDEDNGNEDNGNDGDEAFQDQFDVSAQSIVQQAWAQAVRVDGSVIILNSGNHELVCIRHRASQTLYVSDFIEPHNFADPGYGKLQVGIYIAAIQDTMDRRQQQSQPTSSGNRDSSDNDDDNRGSGGGRKDSHGNRGHERGRGRGEGSGCGSGLQGSGDKGLTDELVAIENMIHVASDRDVIHLYLRYDVYDSPIPASFLRSAPSIMAHTRCLTPPFSPQTNHTYRQEECLTIALTSEIGRGATGVVHRGTLELEICDGAIPLDVVVKLAFGTEQRDALKSEYEVYRRLRSRGVRQGITTTLGLFDDSEGAACALVMLYAGVALSTELQGNFSSSDCKLALSTLESIHRAGILHGDICLENMLIGDLGVTLIDFGHSQQCDDQRAKDEAYEELAGLRYILGLASD